MLISYKWLASFFDEQSIQNKSAFDLAEILTYQGIEIASVKYLGDTFKGVVIGQVKDCKKHPDADKLSICRVSDGKDEFQVICGASNVKAGIKIAFAKIDALLPNDFAIKKAKIRGVESFGMICSEKELGLADKSEGIWILPDDAPIGADLIQFLEMDDYILEIEITPNRGDCLSVLGIAREIAAGLNVHLKLPNISIKNISDIGKKVHLKVADKEHCESYKLALLTNFDKDKTETPIWMKSRLVKSGLRPINLIVDITNYVLLEIGHPMHAFDYEKLNNHEIIVRTACQEKILALDGKEYELTETDLIIADSTNPIAIAGIMGGEISGVTGETKTIVFESAVFNPGAVRKTSKKLALASESSYRFERGTCQMMSELAINRAIALLVEICPNTQILQKEEISKDTKEQKISLKVSKVEKITGKKYPIDKIVEILSRLNFTCQRKTENILEVSVPFYRYDISLEIDLIEEIIRLDGYNNIKAKPMKIAPFLEKNLKWNKILEIKNLFTSADFYEAINYSFLSAKKIETLDGNITDCFKITNPLSEEEEFLNISRLPRLIENAVASFKRQEESIKLFEFGKSFVKNTNQSAKLEDNEKYKLAIVGIGYQENLYWQTAAKKIDFYYIKGLIESFLKNYNFTNYNFKSSSLNFLDASESANILVNDNNIGFIGKLNKKTLNNFDVKTNVYVAELEIDFELLFQNQNQKTKKYTKLSCFPKVSRDLSLVIPKNVKYLDIKNILLKTNGELLKDVQIFDIYENNISIRLTFQSDKKTLEDKTINFLIDKFLTEIDKNFGVKLRV